MISYGKYAKDAGETFDYCIVCRGLESEKYTKRTCSANVVKGSPTILEPPGQKQSCEKEQERSHKKNPVKATHSQI